MFTACVLLTLLTDFSIQFSPLRAQSLKRGLMHFTKKTSSAERSNTDVYWAFGEKVLSGGNFRIA